MLGGCLLSGFSVASEEESGGLRRGHHATRVSSSQSQDPCGQSGSSALGYDSGTLWLEVMGFQSLYGGPGWCLLPEGGWGGLPCSVQPSEVGKRFHPGPP